MLDGAPNYRKNFKSDSGADINTYIAPGDGAMESGIAPVQFGKMEAYRASANANFKPFFLVAALRWNTAKIF